MFELELGKFLNKKGQVSQWPRSQQAKQLVLGYISEAFNQGTLYCEKEINELIEMRSDIGDISLIRRELFNRHLVNRSSDGYFYWAGNTVELGQSVSLPRRFSLTDARETPEDFISIWDQLKYSLRSSKNEQLTASAILGCEDIGDSSQPTQDRLWLIKGQSGCVGILRFCQIPKMTKAVFVAFFGLMPEFRNQQLGSQLWCYIESLLVVAGFRTIMLNVDTGDPAACVFWFRQGYRKIVDFYSVESHVVLQLQKVLP